MGCGASSTNPGAAYPGNRRTPQAGSSAAHFINYGGGNALVPQTGGIGGPQVGIGQKRPEFVSVTLPAGVHAGQTIHVQSPDGRLNEIVVPAGFGPGSTFTVEFEDAPNNYATKPTQAEYPTASATPAYNPTSTQAGNSNYDDGFASGFNNPSFAPATYATTTTTSNYTPYVTANDAKPVSYNAQPY